MPGRTAAFLLPTVLLGFAAGIALHARSTHQAPAVDQSLSEEERTRLLAKGKEIFLERCARCHNERGDKPLKTGVPLNERGLSADVIARAVSGRLRDRAEDERRAVTLYISSLMKTKDSEQNTAPKPQCLGVVASRRANAMNSTSIANSNICSAATPAPMES